MDLENTIKIIEETVENYGYVFIPFFSKEKLEERLKNKEINYISLSSPSYDFSFEINFIRNSETQLKEKLLRSLEESFDSEEIFMFLDTPIYVLIEEVPEFPYNKYLAIGKFVPLNFII